MMSRIEPIFGLQTPLIFAHRGGAREVPESTRKGFAHAKEIAKVDVLELDVQLTKDGEFVVWHGPKLDNVRIKGQDDKPSKRERRKRKFTNIYGMS
jgi:glycerophosphoryl diester phosphodiesterase